MADTKISALPSYTTPLSADVLPIVDTANTATKKIAWSDLFTALAATVQVFTNKTLDTAGSGNVFKINGTSITDKTGTGKAVLDTSPTITSPILTAVAETGVGTADLSAPNNHAITVTSNAGSASQSFLVNTFTNSSAATMAITIPVATPTPKDGQFLEVRIYDFSGVAQTIGWTNTENSTVSAPLTSNGSTTLPLSVLFQFNTATTKWRVLAVA